MNKKRVRVRPFRILSVFLGIVALVMLSRFPAKAVSLERQQEQLELAAEAYYDAQSRNNELTYELSQVNTDEYIERTARREYGFTRYGETVYTVSNLDEITASEFAIYGQE